MIRIRDHDVPPPKVPLHTPLLQDGSTDTSVTYQACLSTLIDIVGEAKNKVYTYHTFSTHMHILTKFQYSTCVCIPNCTREAQISTQNLSLGKVDCHRILIVAKQTPPWMIFIPIYLFSAATLLRSTMLVPCSSIARCLTHNPRLFSNYRRWHSRVFNMTWIVGSSPLSRRNYCVSSARCSTTRSSCG